MFVGRCIESLSSNCLSHTETFVNISENEFKSLDSLHFLNSIEEIIADCNELTECLKLPKFNNLKTLSLNKNKIKQLEPLLDEIERNAPSLRMLSLLGNPVCPDPIYSHINKLRSKQNSTDNSIFETIKINKDDFITVCYDDEDEYFRHRLRIIYRLPNLKFLDSTPVTSDEKSEAIRRGRFLQTKKEVEKVNDTKPRNSLVSLTPNLPDWISGLKAGRENSQEENFTPLSDFNEPTDPRICFGKNHYEYRGKFSEGNRFIRNFDL